MREETFEVYKSRTRKLGASWQPWVYHANCGNGASTGSDPCSSTVDLAKYMATHGGGNSGFGRAVVKNGHKSTSTTEWENPDDDGDISVILTQEEPLLAIQHVMLMKHLGEAMQTVMLEEKTD